MSEFMTSAEAINAAAMKLAQNRAEASAASDVEDEPVESSQEENDAEELEEIETSEGDDEDAAPADDEADAAPDHDEEDDAEADQLSAYEPPQSWPMEREEDWNSLPDQVQQAWIDRDDELHRVKSEAGREVAEAKQAASREQTELSSTLQEINALLPQVKEAAKSRWDAIDWDDLKTSDPETYVQLKETQEAEREAVEKAASEASRQAQGELQRYQQQQFEALTKRPEYSGDEGLKKLQTEGPKVEAFARSLPGVTDEHLSGLSAEFYEVLRDAMKFRSASRVTKAPQKKPAPKTTAKPSARAPQGAGSKKKIEAARTRARNATRENDKISAGAQLLALKRLEKR